MKKIASITSSEDLYRDSKLSNSNNSNNNLVAEEDRPARVLTIAAAWQEPSEDTERNLICKDPSY